MAFMVTSLLASRVLEDDVGIGVALARADLLLWDAVRKVKILCEEPEDRVKVGVLWRRIES